MNSNQQDLNQISAYLQGRLDGEEVKRIQQRIAEDPAFAQLVQELKIIQGSSILSKKKSLHEAMTQWEKEQKNKEGKPKK